MQTYLDKSWKYNQHFLKNTDQNSNILNEIILKAKKESEKANSPQTQELMEERRKIHRTPGTWQESKRIFNLSEEITESTKINKSNKQSKIRKVSKF